MRALIASLCLLALPVHAQSVGRITSASSPDGGHCSGTLVAPNLVLTAAHCVARVESAGIRVLDRQVFVLPTEAGELRADMVSVTFHPSLMPVGDRLNPRADIAFAQLSAPLDADPLALGKAVLDGPVSFVSYRREAPKERLRQDFCYGTETSPFWRLGCRVSSGQSGGAVLKDGALQAVIVARQGGLALALPVDEWVRGAPGVTLDPVAATQ
ncbi:trypsin-like serine peptidase [Pacificoceanicola onchidii]|uniref:trypsin-like serine peptidase n=1 Tax=Pacificoceanicola onchidii TaxID=2562685 RepID=UPI0010A3AC7C|nr:trypsin-like peptidase domain-containing protein [Pacificoceanicola onchidii]